MIEQIIEQFAAFTPEQQAQICAALEQAMPLLKLMAYAVAAHCVGLLGYLCVFAYDAYQCGKLAKHTAVQLPCTPLPYEDSAAAKYDFYRHNR